MLLAKFPGKDVHSFIKGTEMSSYRDGYHGKKLELDGRQKNAFNAVFFNWPNS